MADLSRAFDSVDAFLGWLDRSRNHGTEASCRCGGDCACHSFGQLGGVPCPPTCAHFGDHFDDCHRCGDACNPVVVKRG